MRALLSRLSALTAKFLAFITLCVAIAAIAWLTYEWIVAWRPYWENIGTFCLAYVASWLLAHGSGRRDGMTVTYRLISTRNLVVAGFILAVLAWRIYALASHWQPYKENLAAFCVGSLVGLTAALHGRWEAGWRINPWMGKILRPIGYVAGYRFAFVCLALSTIMLMGALVGIFQSFIFNWKLIALCVAAIIGLVIIGVVAFAIFVSLIDPKMPRAR